MLKSKDLSALSSQPEITLAGKRLIRGESLQPFLSCGGLACATHNCAAIRVVTTSIRDQRSAFMVFISVSMIELTLGYCGVYSAAALSLHTRSPARPSFF